MCALSLPVLINPRKFCPQTFKAKTRSWIVIVSVRGTQDNLGYTSNEEEIRSKEIRLLASERNLLRKILEPDVDPEQG